MSETPQAGPSLPWVPAFSGGAFKGERLGEASI